MGVLFCGVLMIVKLSVNCVFLQQASLSSAGTPAMERDYWL